MRTLLCFIVTGLVCACGSDSGSGGVHSGVNDSEPVNMLNASDAQKVCSAVASYTASRISADVVKKSVCVALAAVQPGGTPPTVDQCNTSVTTCLANTQTPVTTTQNTPMCAAGAIVTACTATVGELEGCASALIDQTASNVEAINCDLFGLPPAEISMRLQPNTTVPAACNAVQQKCPAFLSRSQATPAPSAS
jgi:hypothetical protein